MMALKDSNIPTAVAEVLKQYDALRGKDIKTAGVAFWDMVVITSRDESQKKAYESQLRSKLLWGELPRGVTFKIFADPPGAKIGCGGVTMYVLDSLREEYGDDLFEMKILLINSGGYSQRLPSTSVLGKVFMALPLGEPQMYQLLDYKLACYLPFLPRMRPGVFHAASDTIEVFSLDSAATWSFENEGFTAVAHPNSLDTGVGHGVFVVDDQAAGDVQAGQTKMMPVKEVLQKPSKEQMRAKGAILVNKDSKEEYVYTDSFYFYDHSVTKKFINFYKSNGPFDCELDSYGDYFQPLGPNATEDYVYNTKKVLFITESLIPMRKKLFQLLKGTPLHVVGLNDSKFYHLGSTKENLHHFCSDKIMARELGFKKDAFSVLISPAGCPVQNGKEHESALLNSIVPNSSILSKTAIIEFCHFSIPVVVNDHSIISNCTLSDEGKVAQIVIPPETFLHTVSVKGSVTSGYSTVLFKIDDDIKQRTDTKEDVKQFRYAGKTVGDFLAVMGVENVDDIVTLPEQLTMWDVKLFPVASSMGESFLWALDIKNAIDQGITVQNEAIRLAPKLSMNCIMKQKNVQDMLDYRYDLYSCIAALKCEQQQS